MSEKRERAIEAWENHDSPLMGRPSKADVIDAILAAVREDMGKYFAEQVAETHMDFIKLNLDREEKRREEAYHAGLLKGRTEADRELVEKARAEAPDVGELEVVGWLGRLGDAEYLTKNKDAFDDHEATDLYPLVLRSTAQEIIDGLRGEVGRQYLLGQNKGMEIAEERAKEEVERLREEVVRSGLRSKIQAHELTRERNRANDRMVELGHEVAALRAELARLRSRRVEVTAGMVRKAVDKVAPKQRPHASWCVGIADELNTEMLNAAHETEPVSDEDFEAMVERGAPILREIIRREVEGKGTYAKGTWDQIKRSCGGYWKARARRVLAAAMGREGRDEA